jgi:hypothetical protein
VSTSAKFPGGSKNPLPGAAIQYQYTTQRVLRGRERAAIEKWTRQGWELDNQVGGVLRTDLTFRRKKPEDPWAQLAAAASRVWSAFRGLNPRIQQATAGACAVVVVVLVLFSVLGGGAEVGSAPTKASGPTIAPTTDSPASIESTPSPKPRATLTPSVAPTAAVTGQPPYTYTGPKYQVVTVDRALGPAKLDQHWVLIKPVSAARLKTDVKAIVTDIARKAGTDKLMVEVVTSREIAEAEAVSTYERFVEEHGEVYAINRIPEMEKTQWVASYTGGFDPELSEPSDAKGAFEILWRPAATRELEKWRPVAAKP